MAGLLKPSSIPAKAMRAANALIFRALDAVVVIGRDTEHLLLRYAGLTREKIWFIPNWATLAPGVRPIPADNRSRRTHVARFVVGLWPPQTSGSFPIARMLPAYRCRAGSIICLR